MNGPCLGAGAAMALRYTFRTGHSRSLVKEPATHPSSKWYRISQSIYHTDFNIFYQHLRISQTNKIRAPKTKQNPAYWAGCFVPNSCADFFFAGVFFLVRPAVLFQCTRLSTVGFNQNQYWLSFVRFDSARRRWVCMSIVSDCSSSTNGPNAAVRPQISF